ncbi:MAG: hypothetical protein JW860_08550 [Sedimentisphaerales bacterium]|nr:hypothetical protein [Sedimentisphaerales bacterium]
MINIAVAFTLGVLVTILATVTGLRHRGRRHSIKQRKLIHRTRQAEKKAEAMSKMGILAGHLAHEIRNPLSTIKVNLQLLSEDIKSLSRTITSHEETSSANQTEQLYRRQLRKIETITRETDRLTNTLNDFLRYAGRMEVHLARHDLNEILEDLIDFYEPQAINSNVQIRRSLDKEPAYCRIDKDLIKQAFLNLFINAIQIMDEQGGELMIRTLNQDDMIVVEVIDTGCGMDEQQQEKAFDPYFSTRPGGTGLGLPTCKRIIEEHQGNIYLESEPGKGTRFTIELPRLKD